MRKPFVAVIRQFLRTAFYPAVTWSEAVPCYLGSYYRKNNCLSMRSGTIFVQPIGSEAPSKMCGVIGCLF